MLNVIKYYNYLVQEISVYVINHNKDNEITLLFQKGSESSYLFSYNLKYQNHGKKMKYLKLLMK